MLSCILAIPKLKTMKQYHIITFSFLAALMLTMSYTGASFYKHVSKMWPETQLEGPKALYALMGIPAPGKTLARPHQKNLLEVTPRVNALVAVSQPKVPETLFEDAAVKRSAPIRQSPCAEQYNVAVQQVGHNTYYVTTSYQMHTSSSMQGSKPCDCNQQKQRNARPAKRRSANSMVMGRINFY